MSTTTRARLTALLDVLNGAKKAAWDVARLVGAGDDPLMGGDAGAVKVHMKNATDGVITAEREVLKALERTL